MGHTYEAVISAAGHELFQAAFVSYMEDLGFEHMPAHGRLGGVTSHEFRRKDQSIALTVAEHGQSQFEVVVHSESVPVEPLVLDALTEGVADFLEPFCETLSEGDPEQVLSSLIRELRESFVRVLDELG